MLIIFGIILFYTYKNKKQKQGEVGNSTKEPVDSELEGLEKLSPEELQKMLEQIKSMEKNKWYYLILALYTSETITIP